MTGTTEIRIRKGLDIALQGTPAQSVRDGRSVKSVALLGHDIPGIRPEFRVETGARVRTGDTLFTDRKRPELVFTSPATGVITAIHRGHRRMLDSLVISVEDDCFVQFAVLAEGLTREGARQLLLKSGMWAAFLSRPFGRIPNPDSSPGAIFVTAMDTNPLAADATVILGPLLSHFRRGLEVLKTLTGGPVYVCQSPGPELAAADGQLRIVTFGGPHPAGLAGTHIHHLMPVSADRSVWQIGYQDVIAIGHLAQTGQLRVERVVSLAGPAVQNPQLVRTRLGASLDDLLDGEVKTGNLKRISGSVLSGRISGYLGRYHNQVTVLDNSDTSAGGSLLSRLFGFLPAAPAGPLIPLEAFERVMPLDILPTPLMRALSVGDIETAERLGCLELVEEDVALFSHLCAGKADYGSLLRRTLDELAGDR